MKHKDKIEKLRNKGYGMIGDSAFPIIWRKKGSEYTDECPFCGSNHSHGKAEGHRLSHCSNVYKRGKLIRIPSGYSSYDGKYEFEVEKGYVLKEY